MLMLYTRFFQVVSNDIFKHFDNHWHQKRVSGTVAVNKIL